MKLTSFVLPGFVLSGDGGTRLACIYRLSRFDQKGQGDRGKQLTY